MSVDTSLWNRSQTIPLKSMDSLKRWGDKKGECVFETRMERRRESEERSGFRRGVWEWVRGVIGGKRSKDTNPIEEDQSEFLLGR